MDSAKLRTIGLILGPVLALIIFFLLPDQYVSAQGQPVAMAHDTRVVAGTVGWMAVWWVTEAIPVYATALLPLAVLPAVGGLSIAEVAAPYANNVIYLYLGGFIVALTMQRWNLHRRVAFSALRFAGTRPSRMIAAFMIIAALASMWVSNTATTMMLLPVIMSVIGLVADRPDGQMDTASRNLALGLLLGTAYAASIGGIGTIVGTPPNVFVVSFLENQLGREISFVRWMAIGLPVVVIFIPLAWLALTRWIYPVGHQPVGGAHELVEAAHRELGPITLAERRTAYVFLFMAIVWIFRPLLSGLEIAGRQPLSGLSDAGVAIMAALAAFVIPSGAGERQRLMDWETAVKLPWGVLVLFGGGLSLAAAVDQHGVSTYIGSLASGMAGFPPVLIVLLLIIMMILLTELTSNTATTATLIPIFAAFAPALGMNPLWLVIPTGMAASCAFMLPVATPPNAIVFASERVTILQMVRAGIWLNVIGVLVIGALTYMVIGPVLGID